MFKKNILQKDDKKSKCFNKNIIIETPPKRAYGGKQ